MFVVGRSRSIQLLPVISLSRALRFTRHGGRTLGGIDRLPIVRAIAPIRLPANEITIRYEAFFFLIETGSLPRSVAPTLVTLPSMLGAP